MAKMQARYVPIGQPMDEEVNPNQGKSIQELEQEAALKLKGNYKPLGQEADNVEPIVSKSSEPKERAKLQPLSAIEPEAAKAKLQPLSPSPEESVQESEEIDELEFDLDFLSDLETELEFVEVDIENAISKGEIKLIATTVRDMQKRVEKISSAFDNILSETKATSEYAIVDESKIIYANELDKIVNKFEKLEQNLDFDAYQDELKIQEVVDSQIRTNRYKKRKLEGLDEVGGIAGADHNTSEKNVYVEKEINRITNEKNENFDGNSISQSGERRGGEGPLVKEAFRQDYEGSDLDKADAARDKLEAEILKKQKKEGKSKKQRKTEEQKIEEAKERLRKKQEKRKLKQQKRKKADDEAVPEIDLVGNQFDIEEMREERMDRLLEIKKISAEKKELQKQKEKQRSKATKEFYKYKKVNKKSHIVGFKQ